jgi:hypothetical protein
MQWAQGFDQACAAISEIISGSCQPNFAAQYAHDL